MMRPPVAVMKDHRGFHFADEREHAGAVADVELVDVAAFADQDG